jgi:protein involved in polysaccharide export with SLBB domain
MCLGFPAIGTWRASSASKGSCGAMKLLPFLLVLDLCGCLTQNHAQDMYGSMSEHSSYRAAATDDSPQTNSERLQEVSYRRENDSFTPDFALGPGDVLVISVPDVEEIKQRIERVSAQGTIELPIAGTVRVGGLTESQAKATVIKGLSKYVKEPEVDIFVKQYSSRQVAVTGMVNKPGLYALNTRDDTIMEMIGRAGGMSDQAGSSVILIPSSGSHSGTYLNRIAEDQDGTKANSSDSSSGRNTPATAEQPQVSEGERGEKVSAKWSASKNALPTALPEGSEPIFITVSNGREGKLDVPARPGDVIIVPARGEVLVAGWVKNAGAYQIAPGMTAFGAVTAAGGQMFSSSAEVLRSGPNGEKVQIAFDISKVKSGETADIPVQSGDVVLVKPSAVGAVPYSVWLLFSKFGAGMYIPTF